MTELNDDQLTNVTGGTGKSSQQFDICFQDCLKRLNHPYSSAEDDAQCTKECSNPPKEIL